MVIPKTKETLQLEQQLYQATKKMGVFGCFEVTIGYFGKERVDYMTVDTKGIWRCYELKVTLNDYRSKAKTTFCGNYNYYVMPAELYLKVKDEIPKHIGVLCEGGVVYKKPKKVELTEDVEKLKDSMIRSLYRDASKGILNKNNEYISKLKKQIKSEKTQKESYMNKYFDLLRKVEDKYGRRWDR